MASGGTIIALVGGDGAGKSTSIAELRDWLSREFDIKTTHLGRPARSLTTNVVRALLKAGRALCAPLGQWPGFAKFMKKNLAASELWWHVCTGRDRYRLYVKTRRFASDGGIVICDRFPLEQVKLMDGPQNERITNANKRNRLVRYLVRLEKKWYRSIVSPELLIVLKLDPEIAVRRKPEEVPSFVRERSDEIWRLDWSDSEACVIDASQPRANVMSQLKSLVWSSL